MPRAIALSLSLLTVLCCLPPRALGQDGLPYPPPPAEAEAGPRSHRFVVLPTKVREHMERNGRSYRRGAGAVAETFASPVFLGAIVADELAHGALEGDPDKPGDVRHMLNTPDFYTSIAMFNMSLRAGDQAWNTASKAARRAGLGRVAPTGKVARVSSKAVGSLRHNLVLATALTLPRAIRVDFGGATFSQMIRGDFSKLDLNVGKGDMVGWDELGITLGSFALAGPPVRALVRGTAGSAARRFAWPGLRKLVGTAGRLITRRVARTAAVKGGLAVAPVPGSRVAAGVLTAGEVLWGVAELGGTLFVAGQIEEPVHRWNDTRKMTGELTDAIEHLLTVARDAENPDADRQRDIAKDAREREEKLAEEYRKMARDLYAVAMGPVRIGETGQLVDAAYLRSLDPDELTNLHPAALEFEGARESYEHAVENMLREAERLFEDGKRDRLLRYFEDSLDFSVQMVAGGGALKRASDGEEITPELLAGMSLASMKRTLDYERVVFPMTGKGFLSSPHPLGAENFTRVVQDRAKKILELHEEIDADYRQLDPEAALDDALVQVAQLFADYRDYLYLDQAIADETFLQRLQRWGESPDALGALVERVIQQVGPWEALPGQTLALRDDYELHDGLPGHPQEAMDTTTRHFLEEAQSRVRDIYAQGKVGEGALVPEAREPKKKSGWGRLKFWESDEDDAYHLADSWQLSGNRRQLFEQEINVYAKAMELVGDPTLRERLGSELVIVDALRALDDEIVRGILAPLKERPEEPAPSAAAPLQPSMPKDRLGMTDALRASGPR